MTMPTVIRRAALALLFGFAASRAAVLLTTPTAGTIEWTNNTAWSLGHIPANGETPQISSETVTVTGSANTQTLNFFGGVLTNISGGNGTLSLTSTGAEWRGGNMNSSSGGKFTFQILAGANLAITSTADHDFNASAITNTGTVNWSGGRLRSGNGGVFTNSATFNDSASGTTSTQFNGDYANGATFANAAGGSYNKSATGTTSFTNGAVFNNSGAINVTAGTLQFNAGGTNSSTGTILVSSGALMQFSNSYTIADGSLLTGAGTYQVTGGTFTLSGSLGSSNFQLSGGTLAGTHTLNGTSTWNGGNVNSGGTTTIAKGATLAISPSGTSAFDHDFNSRAIVNNGTVNWQSDAGRLRSGNGGTFTNNGTFNDSGSGTTSTQFNADYSNGATFTNATAGIYNKSATGTTTFTNGAVFNNDGAINVNAGTLQFNAGGTNSASGTMTVASGALMQFTNTYTIADGSQLSGAGTYQVTAGTFTVSGNVGISNFQFSGGTLAGTHTLNGTTTWNGGNLNSGGTTTIASGATLNIAPSGTSAFDHDFSARAIVNNGIVNWQANAGRLRSGNAGTFTNNGTFNDAASNVWNNDYGNTALIFTNGATGTYNKTAAGTTRFDVPFNNNGTVSVTAGTLQFNGGGTLASGTTMSAAANTSVIFSNSYTLANASSLTGAGAFAVTGGTLTATGNVNVTNFAVSGGTLAGTQTFNGGLIWNGGNVNSGGTTTIAAGSTFSIAPSGTSAFDHDFSAHAFVNNGTTTWEANAGRLRSGNGGTFTNNSLFIDAASNAVNNDYGNATLVFTNSAGATYRKTAAGTTTMQVPFINSGTLDLQAGTLALTSTNTFNDAMTQIGTGLLQLASGSLVASGTMTFSNFQIAGGTVSGNHTFNGAIEWTGGNFNSGSSTTTIGGTLTIDSGADHDFSAHAFVNNGTVNWAAGAGRLRSGNGGTFTNNATFNDAASNVWNNDLGNAALVFTNSTGATYNKTAAGTTRFDVPFNNNGTIKVTGGTLQLNGGGTLASSGVVNAATNTSVVFSNDYTLANASSLTGAGSFAMTGGTLTASGTVNVSNFAVSGGTLAGTQSFSGGLIWNGGNVNSSGTTTIAAGSTFSIAPSGASAFDHDFSAHTFINNGTTTWQANAGRLRSGNGGVFTNNSLFIDAASNAVNNDLGNATLVFTNSAGATYRKTAAGTTTFSVPFVNSGVLDLQAGTLALTSSTTFNDGSSQIGAALLQLAGGSLVANGTMSFTNFQIVAGNVSGNHTFNGTVEWTNGTFNSGSSTTTLGGTTTIDSGADHDFNAHAFINNGTVNWAAGAGRLRSGNAGTFTNNGTFNDSASNVWNNDLGNTLAQFTNASTGTYNKSAAGTTTVAIGFVNSGTINAQAGSLDLAAGGSSTTGALFNVSAGASLRFTGGSFTLADSSGFSGQGTVQIAGATTSLAGNVTAPIFSLASGTLAGTQTFLGNFTWSGGNMNAAGTTTIGNGATLTISTGNDHDFSAHAIVNNGTVSWTGGRLRSGNGGSITNNAVFNDTSGSVANNDLGNAILTFTNSAGATYNQSGGNTTTWQVPFNNAGTVNVASGSALSLTNGGTIGSGAAYTGAGQTLLASGTFTASGSITSTGLVLAGATLAGTQTLAGTFQWSSGNFNSGSTTTTIPAGATFNITSGADHDFSAHAFVNNGTVNWTAGAGRLRSGNGGTFTNNALFLDNASNVWNNDLGNAALVFTNSAGASYTKNGTGTTTFQVPFTNSGVVTTSGGSLVLSAGGTITAGANFDGAGSTLLTGGTFTATGLFNSSNLVLAGATLAGTHSLGGTFNWSSGNFNTSNTTTIPAGSTFTISSSADHDFNAHAFVNNGTVNWTAGAGRMRSGNGGTFTNSGTFNDSASNVWNNDYGNTVLSFSNASGASYNKNAAGTTTFQVPFTNSGTIAVSAGALVFTNTFTNNNGAIALSNGASLQAPGPIAMGTGALTGTGTITASSVTAGGTVAPGNSAGTLAISGNFTLLSTSTFLAELAGTTQGSGYDFLSIGGNGVLGGTLSLQVLNSFLFTAPANSTFTILTASGAGGLTGAFSNVANGQRLTSLEGGVSFQVNYGLGSAFAANSVVLSNFVGVPEPSTWAMMVAGAMVMVAARLRRRFR